MININRRNLKLDSYGISRKRYKELCGFCEQYPEWVDELHFKTSTLKGQDLSGLPKGTRPGNATEDLAIRRSELLNKCQLIERTAFEADRQLYQYIIKSVCYEKTIRYLIQTLGMPCSESAFKDRRRYFFYLLSENKK